MTEHPAKAGDDVREMLRQSLDMLSEVTWGLPGYLDRISELTGSYPGGGGMDGGGRSKGSHSDPTAVLAQAKRDPFAAEMSDFRKKAGRVYKDLLELHRQWDANRAPKLSPDRKADPGCEPCTSIPATLPNGAPGYPMHFCPSHTTADILTKSRKGKRDDIVQKVRLCSSCYTFWRRNERLPTVAEVVAHVEGKRRKTPVPTR